jgi:hypothetical protein
MKLTVKQENFAQAIADGMTQADAYRLAYNAQKMTDKTTWERASAVAKNSKVAARVLHLKAAIAEKQLWTREQSVKALITAAQMGQDNGKPAELVAAIKELNAMHGFNHAHKVELTGKDGSPIQTATTVLTPAAAKAAAQALQNDY